MRVLVTGGAGYIGSVLTEQLLLDRHDVVVYDSLYKGHLAAVSDGAHLIQADLSDSRSLKDTLCSYQIQAVIHMAADSLVGESVTDPSKYFRNNLSAGLSLLDAMRDCNVTSLVFSSTAAVYGEPLKQPIEESDPTQPTNPYGESKLAFERALRWYSQAYGLGYVSLRYFNAAGASLRFGESHDPETHIIPIVLGAAAGRREFVEVYGEDYPTRDGTCVRDYVHVVDLARAHILAMEWMQGEGAGAGGRVYNLGCGGEGYSVREVIEAAEEVSGQKVEVRVGERRPGDPAVLVASSERIREELGWRPEREGLREIIESAWVWMQDHPNGYKDSAETRP
jgi:UDP-glucose 4-epimerase